MEMLKLPELKEDFSKQERKEIQETTLSKDVLARYQCNTVEEVKAAAATPGTDFNAIVIGSGMYGAFCAERIYRRGGRVLVLEAGPFVVSEHVQNMADPAFDVVEADDLTGFPAFGEYRSPAPPSNGQNLPIQFAKHSYNVGGKSIRWGGWSPRLTEEDLALWPADMAQYFRDYYREVEFQIGAFPTADFIKGPLAEAIFARTKPLEGTADIVQVLPPPIAVQAEQPASGLFSFDKYSSLPVLIESLRGDAKAAFGRSLSQDDANSRRAIIVVPRCRVLRLETAPTGNGKRRVTALRVIHGNITRKIDLITVPPGCAVVLAANSMESTRLALESFVEPQDAQSVRIGRNFQVHLRTDITVRIPRSVLEADLRASALRYVEARERARSPLDPPDPRKPGEQVDAMLGALQTAALHIQCSTGNRRFHLQLVGVSDPGGNPEALMYRQDTSLPELTDILGSMRSSWIAIRFVLVAEIFPDRSLPVGDPNTNWVRLSEFDRDSFSGEGDQNYSARKLYSYIQLTAEDEALWLKMDNTALDVAEKIAGPGGNVEYFYKSNLADPQESSQFHAERPSDHQLRNLHHPLGSTFHESGTMWMDPDPVKGVVDCFGRFLNVENAYCCDQAVFPTSGSANPVPTGLVVAKRVSEAIMPDSEVKELGFNNLFIFSEPKGDYPDLPTELSALPTDWRFVGGGRFVRRGKIIETVQGIGLLYYSAKPFKDFILKLEWRCPLPMGNYNFFNNAGVYIRWPAQINVGAGQQRSPDELSFEEFNTFAIKQGYEIQIDDTGYRPEPEFSGFPQELNNPYHLTGAIYPVFFDDALPPKLPRFNANPSEPRRTGNPASSLKSRAPGEWNEYEITAQGNHFVIKLNGEVVNDATDHDNAYPTGLIGLQNHFNGYRVQFRNLRIKEL